MADSTDPKPAMEQAPPKDGDSSLQQPKDAMPMTSLPLSQSEGEQAKDGTSSEEPPVPAKDAPATSEATEQAPPKDKDAPAAVASSGAEGSGRTDAKGKGKASPPLPPPALFEGTTQVEGGGSGSDADADLPPASPTTGGADAIVCRLTLIIVSTGGKWNFRVDARYLEKREVEIPETRPDGRPDPFSISIKTLKQLLLRDWRPEWGAKPPDSQYMKLISYGKVLEDTWRLMDAKFSELSENPVHVSVTPIDMIHEDEAEGKNLRDKSSGGGRRGDRGERSGCCVIL